jgi:hypothetical protein
LQPSKQISKKSKAGSQKTYKPAIAKKYVPTDEDRESVRYLKSCGFTNIEIGQALDISDATLLRHYRKELDVGFNYVHGRLAKNAIQLALSGDKTMMIFILKTKFGWSENRPAVAEDFKSLILSDTDPETSDRGSI